MAQKNFATHTEDFVLKVLSNHLRSFSLEQGLLINEQWHKRQSSVDVFEGVYDGKVWNDFQVVNGRDFLSRPHSFGLMMNIDWFQPFKLFSRCNIYGCNESSSC